LPTASEFNQYKIVKAVSSWLKALFTDKQGKVVVWQKPNLPLWSWFVFMVLSKMLDSHTLKTDAQYLSTVSLLIWAILEIAKGASIFRRLLGLIVLVWIIHAHF
jgi:hypothetical protein